MSEWISTKDRLPEEDVEVLVTYEIPGCDGLRILEIGSYGKEAPLSKRKCWITRDSVRLYNNEIKGWMPLPEIYKGE